MRRRLASPGSCHRAISLLQQQPLRRSSPHHKPTYAKSPFDHVRKHQKRTGLLGNSRSVGLLAVSVSALVYYRCRDFCSLAGECTVARAARYTRCRRSKRQGMVLSWRDMGGSFVLSVVRQVSCAPRHVQTVCRGVYRAIVVQHHCAL